MDEEKMKSLTNKFDEAWMHESMRASKITKNSHDIDKSIFKSGWDAKEKAQAEVSSAGVEFDETGAIEASSQSNGQVAFVKGARYQHQQNRAALSAMKSKTDGDWKRMDEAKDAFAVHTTELENELEKLRAENAILREGLTKVGYVLQSTDSTKMYAREVLTAAEKVSVK